VANVVKTEIKIVKSIPLIEGWRWIVQALRLFHARPLEWLLYTFILMGLSLVLAQLGVFGTLLLPLLLPVFTGGFMQAAREAFQGGKLTPRLLFSGFDRRGARLVSLGGLYLVCIISLSGYLQLSGLLPSGFNPASIKPGTPEYHFLITHSTRLLIAALIELVVLLPVSMATLFAPALIMFHELSAFAALRLSFLACCRNIGAIVVYGFFVTLGGILILLSAGFAVFIIAPLVFLSTFAGYIKLFEVDKK